MPPFWRNKEDGPFLEILINASLVVQKSIKKKQGNNSIKKNKKRKKDNHTKIFAPNNLLFVRVAVGSPSVL